MKLIMLWLAGSVLYLVSFSNSNLSVIGIISSLIFCFISIYIFRTIPPGISRTLIAYSLFLSTSVLSFFNIITPLTGSVSESTNILFYGFSFYSASLAYLVIKNVTPSFSDSLKVANPLLLSTGPIALFINNYSYRRLHLRVNYFLPFILVGFFLFHIVAAPLTATFELIKMTDAISSIVFAVIFELFVYANFCGLSLMLYGLFGIFGYKIPLNFKQPFSSSNIIEFWRGWHLSLSAVLKLLFYTPIRKIFPSSVALIVLFLASAMWHGITLNFFIWGCLHALVFISTIFLLKKNIPIAPMIILILGIILGRLIFADSDVDRLMQKLLFTYEGFGAFDIILSLPIATKVSLMIGFGLIAIEFFFRNTNMLRKRNYKHLRTPISLTVILLITIFLIDSGNFIYAVYGQR